MADIWAGGLAEALDVDNITDREDAGLSFRIKETDHGEVHVLETIYNWRVALSDGTGYVAGWCYKGRGIATLVAAVTAAKAWDGDPRGPGPAGYFKHKFRPGGDR